MHTVKEFETLSFTNEFWYGFTDQVVSNRLAKVSDYPIRDSLPKTVPAISSRPKGRQIPVIWYSYEEVMKLVPKGPYSKVSFSLKDFLELMKYEAQKFNIEFDSDRIYHQICSKFVDGHVNHVRNEFENYGGIEFSPWCEHLQLKCGGRTFIATRTLEGECKARSFEHK